MNAFRYLLLLLYLSGYFIPVYSQSANIEEAKSKIYTAESPKERLAALIAIGKHRNSMHGDTIYYYAQWAKSLALQLNDARAVAWAEYSMLSGDLAKGKADTVLHKIESNKIFDQIKNTDAALYFKVQLLKANALNRKNDRTGALELQLKLLELAEQEGNNIAKLFAMNYIGATYFNLGRTADARRTWNNALQIINDAENQENQEIEAYLLSNVSLLYFNEFYVNPNQKIQDSFLIAIDKTISLSSKNEYLGVLASALSLRGSFYGRIKQFEKGEIDIQHGLSIRKKIGDPLYIVNDFVGLSNYYLSQQAFSKCIENATEGIALAEKYGIKGEHLQLYLILANAYKSIGNYESYGDVLEKYVAAIDVSYKMNAADKVAEIETKYEVQKKETLIAKQKLAIFQRNLFLYGGIIMVALLLVILTFRFKKYQRLQKATVAAMMEEEKRQNEQAIKAASEKERKRIAAELHDNLGVQANAILYNSSLLHTDDDQFNLVISDLQDTAKEMLHNLRETLWAMKTTDVSGKELWLRVINFMKQMGRHYTMISFKVEGDVVSEILLPSNKALNIILVIQETVNNSVKHANAQTITATSASDGSNWVITLKDDGTGFDPDSTQAKTESYGIQNMKERALSGNFTFQIESTKNKGTTTTIFVNN